MPISSYPPAVPKRFVTTLTSGTSWTVPTGVTQVNVTLFGGGGGGSSSVGSASSGTAGGTGGTTTFTGATSAPGGTGMSVYPRVGWSAQITVDGVSAISNSGLGGYSAGNIDYSGSQGVTAGPSVTGGMPGAIIASNVSTTPGASISYSIGAGGSGGAAPTNGKVGGTGGSGKIEIEYWV